MGYYLRSLIAFSSKNRLLNKVKGKNMSNAESAKRKFNWDEPVGTDPLKADRFQND